MLLAAPPEWHQTTFHSQDNHKVVKLSTSKCQYFVPKRTNLVSLTKVYAFGNHMKLPNKKQTCGPRKAVSKQTVS